MNHLDVYCICLINSAYHVTNFTTVHVFYGRTKKVNQISVASGHINGRFYEKLVIRKIEIQYRLLTDIIEK